MILLSGASVRDILETTGNVFLEGPNFSGRTDMLKTVTGLLPQGKHVEHRAAYVAPEVHNGISGLTQSVAQELQLNRADECPGLSNLIDSTALSQLHNRNPFTLSGGEQALLAIATAIASGRDACGIDCAAEQLDYNNRSLLFQWMTKHPPDITCVRMIADNRMSGTEFDQCIRLAPGEDKQSAVQPDEMQILEIESTDIGLNNVSFRYSRTTDWILRNCSVEFEAGKIYILKGPNGAGKSTLAKLLTGVLKPAQGAITNNGNLIDMWRQPGRLVGYHFQNPDLQLFCPLVIDEFRQNRELSGEFCEGVAKAFGLSNVLAAHPLDLPFVLRKRLGLASTVSMMRPWLIFDEPVLGQDRVSAHAIATLLKRLCAAGIGLIIISHFEWFDSLFDATHLFIDDGQIIVRTNT